MTDRAACPEYFLVKSSDPLGALMGIIERYKLDISDERLLSVCGKCGGDILPFVKCSAPEDTSWPADRDSIPENVPVFVCESCSQLYWYN
jgi:uncharacterized protein with PIN domain